MTFVLIYTSNIITAIIIPGISIFNNFDENLIVLLLGFSIYSS